MKYRIIRFITKYFFIMFMTPKIVGRKNIPSDGRIILAGNHTSNFDPLLVMACTKRKLHFLSKKELFKFPQSIIFNNMGLIPVDRAIKDKSVIPMSKKYLKEGKAVTIFPEGTTEKGRGQLPFKIGTIKIAYESDTKIVPFAITGKYKLFSKSLKIEFKEAYSIKGNNLDLENKKLENIIKEMVGDSIDN